MAKDPDNPFATAEAWETSTEEWLKKGNYVCEIMKADGRDKDGGPNTSSKGNPQIDLRLECAQGYILDWLRYHEENLGRIVQLYDCAGVQRPQDGEFDPNDHCRISDAALDRLVGKRVGVVVREEEDYNDPEKMRNVVAGYVEPSRVKDDAPADTRGLPEAGAAAAVGSGTLSDSDIPF